MSNLLTIPEPFRLLLSCEHAVNEVPPEFRHLFSDHPEVLQTHRGYDRHALDLAERLASAFNVPLFAATVSRLLVDCNRPPASNNLFSNYSRSLTARERARIRTAWHTPHQEAVTQAVANNIAAGEVVVHIAVHTFTPELNGRIRTADIGLLYDPVRPWEQKLCACWKEELKTISPSYRVRRNYPYLGKTAGLPFMLRKLFAENTYVGVELEINQVVITATSVTRLAGILADSLASALLALTATPIVITEKFGGKNNRLSV